jgi:hypothetical protein
VREEVWRRENIEERALQTPPLFLNFVAGAAGVVIVPLHSPFSASGLLYES